MALSCGTVGVSRRVMLQAWWLVIVQVLLVLGAIAYFFVAGFVFYEFYESVAHSTDASVSLRTDTWQFAQHVLGMSSSGCAEVIGAVPAFGSRFSSSQGASGGLTFSPSCLDAEASLQAAAAINLASEARLPTSRIVYETIRIPNADVSTATNLQTLGFRTVASGSSVSGIRATGSMYALDPRLISLQETISVIVESLTTTEAEQRGTSGVEPFTGREDDFAFTLVDASGATVSRCLQQGFLSANVSVLASDSTAAQDAALFVPCTTPAGTAANARPLLTLDALFASAGVTAGLNATDTALTAVTGSETPIPYHLAGAAIDLEIVYDNLPDYSQSADTQPLTLRAQAVLTSGSRATWLSDSASTSPTYTALPQAAFLSLRSSVTAAQCTSLGWQSTSTDVDNCIAAVGGDANTAFDTTATAGLVRSTTETLGVVVRTAASGSIVRFNYTELASLAVQALTKYITVMTTLVMITLFCWPSAAQAVYEDLEDVDDEGKGGEEAALGSGDPDSKSAAAAASASGSSAAGGGAAVTADIDAQAAAMRAEVAARRDKDEENEKEEEAAKAVEERLDAVEAKLRDHRRRLDVIAVVEESKGLVYAVNRNVVKVDNRVTKLQKTILREARNLSDAHIRKTATTAAKEAVYEALTGTKHPDSSSSSSSAAV